MNIRSQIYGLHSASDGPLVRAKKPQGARADDLLSIRVNREQSRHVDSRSERRFALVSERASVSRASVSSARSAHQAQLLNISDAGAMISAPFEPSLWQRLKLHLSDSEAIDCSVIWIRPDRIGLEFSHETSLDCPEDERREIVRQVILRHYPDAQIEAPQPEPGDLRNAFRHPFIWSGTLHCEYGSTAARLRNISSDGALIETSFELAPEAEPYLDLGEAGAIFGTVVWTQDRRSGLRFHQPFDMSRLAHARPELSTASDGLVRFGSSKP